MTRIRQATLKNKNSTVAPANKSKRWLKPAILVPALLVVILAGWGIGVQIQPHFFTQSRMVAYLNKKYGMQFKVEKYYVVGASIGDPGIPVAEAYPATDHSLRFKVRGKGFFGFEDNYPGAVWGQAETITLKPLLKNIFGYDPKYTVTVTTIGNLSHELMGNIGSFEDGAKKYGSRINMSVTVTARERLENDVAKELIASRVYSLSQTLKPLGIDAFINYMAADGTGRLSVNLNQDITGETKSVADLINMVNRVEQGQ
jgi:hypothetical protein